MDARKNPIKLIEPQVIYQLNDGPLKRVVVERLNRQGYVKKSAKYDRVTGKEYPSYYMTSKGYANIKRAVLPGWEDWQESVEKAPEIDGLDAARILYGK